MTKGRPVATAPSRATAEQRKLMTELGVEFHNRTTEREAAVLLAIAKNKLDADDDDPA